MSRIRKLNLSDVSDATAVLHSAEPWDSNEGFRERSRQVLESVSKRTKLSQALYGSCLNLFLRRADS